MSADQYSACPECAKLGEYSTFREYVEVYGAETGTLTFSYGGHCRDCDFEFEAQQTWDMGVGK